MLDSTDRNLPQAIPIGSMDQIPTKPKNANQPQGASQLFVVPSHLLNGANGNCRMQVFLVSEGALVYVHLLKAAMD